MAAIAQATSCALFHQIDFTSRSSSTHFTAANRVELCLPFHDVQSSGYPFLFRGIIVSDRKRIWNRSRRGFDGDEYDDDLEDEDEEEDRSLDLLVKFVQNAFKKISKKARKAVRSVLPVSIPTELVGFSVDGVIMLAFLWLAKASLEVVCTLGTVVFVSILLIRGIWSGITHIQQDRANRLNVLDGEQLWNRTRPAM